jgi:hypothetical protein
VKKVPAGFFEKGLKIRRFFTVKNAKEKKGEMKENLRQSII